MTIQLTVIVELYTFVVSWCLCVTGGLLHRSVSVRDSSGSADQ